MASKEDVTGSKSKIVHGCVDNNDEENIELELIEDRHRKRIPTEKMKEINKQKAERDYHVCLKRWKRLISETDFETFEKYVDVKELRQERDRLEVCYKELVTAKTTLEDFIETEEELESHTANFNSYSNEINKIVNMFNKKIHDFVSVDSDKLDSPQVKAHTSTNIVKAKNKTENPQKVQNLESNTNVENNESFYSYNSSSVSQKSYKSKQGSIHSEHFSSRPKSGHKSRTNINVPKINDNDIDNVSVHSRRSNTMYSNCKSAKSNQSRSSKGSCHSINSLEARMERAAKAVRLKTELKFFDADAALTKDIEERKANLEKHRMKKELAVTTAEIKVIDKVENYHETHSNDIDLPVANNLNSYLDTQLQSVAPVEHTHTSKDNATKIINTNETADQITDSSRNPDVPQSKDPISHLADILLKTHARDSLPKPEPDVFKGDSLLYPVWSKSFKHFVEERTNDPSELLFYLDRYTAGEAKECIKGLLGLDTTDACERAKQLLHDRYGNPFVVANAYRKKLNDWSKIPHNDGQALRRFSDFLQNCKTAMESVKYLSLLDDPEENQKLLRKLPYSVSNRWSRIADSAVNDLNTYPLFSTFADFIEKEARILCNPITSHNAVYADTEDRKSRSKSSSRTLSTAVNESQCVLCRNYHSLDTCKKFLDLSVKEKFDFILKHSICLGCLTVGHMKAKCNKRKICTKCKGFHPTALHDDNYSPRHSNGNTTKASGKSNGMSAVVNHITGSRCVSHTLIVPVKIYQEDNPTSALEIYAVIDDQSDACFVDDKLIDDLRINGTETDLSLSTMLGTSVIKSKKISGLVVRGINQGEEISLPTTYSRDEIPVSRSQIPRRESVDIWPHLRKIRHDIMPHNPYIRIGLLIGINCIKAVKPLEVIPGKESDPYAVRTALGWGIIGMVESGDTDESTTHLCTSTVGVKTCHFAFRTKAKELMNPKQVVKMFELDFNEDSNEKQLSYEDSRFLSIVEKGIHETKDGRFEMPLPFRDADVKLPDNKSAVLKRLNGLRTKFAKDKKYEEDYRTFMKKIMDSGFAEIVPTDELSLDDGHVWYIPHHGVYHPKKPNKIRVVFDCSHTYQGYSLNNHLLHGPDLTNNLVGVLCRFRKDKVAFICDIESMFFQLKVNIEHRNYLRFFWWDSDDFLKEPTVYRMTVHLFGASSSPGCANYGLKAAANKYESELGTQAAEFIRRDFYVDDGLKSVSSVEEAKDLISSSKEICERGGFHLHKFLCNDKDVLTSIPEEERASGTKTFGVDKEQESIQRALGVQWCVESDTFRFRIDLQDRPLTRRGILSTVSSVFDPLGLVSPFILIAKKLLQTLCRESNSWDDPVSENVRQQWTKWRTDLLQLAEIQIQRSFKPAALGRSKLIELHHFSDASLTGYGQCSYLRLIDDNDQIHVSLVLAKSRVTPTKLVTIPRLELTAAVVSIKVAAMLKKELDYDSLTEYFWTDSQVVLGYVSNEVKRFHTYVANRVQQIRTYSTPEQWNYIESDNNPADDASRGLQVKELVDSRRWWNGPEFLWSTTDLRFDHQDGIRELDEEDPEVRRSSSLSTTTEMPKKSLLDKMAKFSNWHKLQLAISLLLRVQDCYKKHHLKANQSLFTNDVFNPSVVEDLKRSEIVILREVQRLYFSEEIKILTKLQKKEGVKDRTIRKEEKVALKASSPLYKLDVFLDDDGIIRVGGRIQNADLPVDCKHPVIIPKQGHITELIVRAYHSKSNHQGRGITHSLIRSSGYWIVGGRSVISSIISKCVTCKKLIGSTQVQKMSSLPKDRLEPAPPFSYAAVDYFGPWVVREGRREVKRYGVVFVCMASRAIHLEVAHRMDTDSFLNCYRRFICRRGPVRQLRSDQGTNFVGAQTELKAALKEMNNDGISKELLKTGCDWITFKMNTPESSHMGGSWERLIRSVRNVLVALLHNHGTILDDETLLTFMTEAESVINNRPLAINDINDPDYPSPITPNHLLTMKGQLVLPPPGVFVREDMYLRKRWRRVQFLANEFWKRWRHEYLQSLQVRQKWLKPVNNLNINDIVLIKDDKLPRNVWKLGRVSKTFPSADNLTRKVKVELACEIDKYGKRQSPRKVLERPIHKLVLILAHKQGDPGIPVEEP